VGKRKANRLARKAAREQKKADRLSERSGKLLNRSDNAALDAAEDMDAAMSEAGISIKPNGCFPDKPIS